MPILLLDLLVVSAIGFLGAAIMTIVEIPFWKKWGLEGVADWQVNAVLVSKLIGKSKSVNEVGLFWINASKLSHGVAAGLVFRLLLSVIFWLIPVSNMLLLLGAVVYSIALWVIFLVIGRKTFESVGGIRITRVGLLSGLLTLIAYGIVLGLLSPFTF
jgi:hypothetical protein